MNIRRLIARFYCLSSTVHVHAFSSKKKGFVVPPAIQDLYVAKTKNQEKYVDALNNAHTAIIVAMGPAGTGKTLFACQKAITELKKGKI